MNTNSTPTTVNDVIITTTLDLIIFYRQRMEWFNNYLIRVSDQNDPKNSLFNHCVFDHVGYRCESNNHYKELMTDIFQSKLVKEIHQDTINGREISIVKLSEKIKTTNSYFGSVEYLEICDVKPNADNVVGFDHVEMVYTKNPNGFYKTKTFEYFKKNDLADAGVKHRDGYKYPLYEIKNLYNGFRLLITKGEYLWDIANTKTPSGLISLE